MDKNLYLRASEIIDWETPSVLYKADELALNSSNEADIVKKSFEFVRDEIFHCMEYKMNPVTSRASDVLKYKTGFCYSKSHLLAALLRANSIPAGFCYQRLISDSNDKQYSLHGLNCVFLKEYGWYRIDARGNKDGVNAQFNPPYERLAFNTGKDGEADFKEIWYEPLELIKDFLSGYKLIEDAVKHLPDIEVADRH